MKSAILCTTLTIALLTVLTVLLVITDIVELNRISYSDDYGAYALIFSPGIYIPLYALPAPSVFLATLVFIVFLGVERKLSLEEITERTGGISMLSAILLFIGGLIATLITDPPNMVSRVIFTNTMGATIVGVAIGMLSIATCVLAETIRNRRIKRCGSGPRIRQPYPLARRPFR